MFAVCKRSSKEVGVRKMKVGEGRKTKFCTAADTAMGSGAWLLPFEAVYQKFKQLQRV